MRESMTWETAGPGSHRQTSISEPAHAPYEVVSGRHGNKSVQAFSLVQPVSGFEDTETTSCSLCC